MKKAEKGVEIKGKRLFPDPFHLRVPSFVREDLIFIVKAPGPCLVKGAGAITETAGWQGVGYKLYALNFGVIFCPLGTPNKKEPLWNGLERTGFLSCSLPFL